MLELVDRENVGTRQEPVLVYSHYALAQGGFVAAAPLDFYQVFYRAKGAPKTETLSFAMPKLAPGQKFRLAVLNGGPLGKDSRVASGTITLNGVVISPPADFSESRSTWTVPITLQEQNALTVRLDGKPSTRIGIAIRHD